VLEAGVDVVIAEGEGLAELGGTLGVPPGVPLAAGVAVVLAPGVPGAPDGPAVGVSVVVSSGSVGALGGGGTYCGSGESAAAKAVIIRVLCRPMTSMKVGPRSKAISLPCAS